MEPASSWRRGLTLPTEPHSARQAKEQRLRGQCWGLYYSICHSAQCLPLGKNESAYLRTATAVRALFSVPYLHIQIHLIFTTTLWAEVLLIPSFYAPGSRHPAVKKHVQGDTLGGDGAGLKPKPLGPFLSTRQSPHPGGANASRTRDGDKLHGTHNTSTTRRGRSQEGEGGVRSGEPCCPCPR